MEFYDLLRSFVHFCFHLFFPGLIAWYFFQKNWKKAWLVMLATMLVDLDHLLATPLFDAERCSIGFHPMHSYYAIAVYAGLFFLPKGRIIASGLLLHMATDGLDCWWMRL